MPAPRLLIGDEEEAPRAARSVDDLLDTYAPRQKSVMESLLRGGAQGAAADFADEIAGGVESAFSEKSYVQARDESRANYKAAQRDNPLAYGAGKVVGTLASVLLPGGQVVKGAGLGANIVRGAAYGAASAAGESEAPVYEGIQAGDTAPLEELGGEMAKGAAGGAAAGAAGHLALTGLAKILTPVSKLAGKVTARASKEADAYAGERLAGAQRVGDEALAKESERFAPLLEKEPANRAAAVASPAAAAESGGKALTERAWDRLRIETPNQLKKKTIGKLGANEGEMKAVLAGDRELRAAIDASTEPGVGVGAKAFKAGEGPDAALEVLGKRLDVEGQRLDRIYTTAQDATPGGKPQAVLSGLRALRDEYAGVGATKPVAKAVEKEMKRIQADYVATKKAIPLQKMREEYRAWQDAGYSGGGQFSESATKELQRNMAQVWRDALHEEIERVASRNPSKMGDLTAELQSANKRTSALIGVKNLLEEWSTRSHSAAPTMGEMTLSPLKAIRTAVEREAVEGGRAVLGNVAAAAARRGPAGAPSAAVARLMNAARSGALTTQAIRDALDAGVSQEMIDQVQGFAARAR